MGCIGIESVSMLASLARRVLDHLCEGETRPPGFGRLACKYFTNGGVTPSRNCHQKCGTFPTDSAGDSRRYKNGSEREFVRGAILRDFLHSVKGDEFEFITAIRLAFSSR